MPRCPHCDYAGESASAFVYKVGVGEEGHDISGEPLSTYLVCPSCEAMLGSPNVYSDL